MYPQIDIDAWTPYIGSVTLEEYELQFADIFNQVTGRARGTPINVVNPQVFDLLRSNK